MPKQIEISLHDSECRQLQSLADAAKLWPAEVAELALRYTLTDPSAFSVWLAGAARRRAYAQAAVEFERLAAEQTAFAKERADHAAQAAAIDKQLASRSKELDARENALKAAEAKVSGLERDLERRLSILKSVAA